MHQREDLVSTDYYEQEVRYQSPARFDEPFASPGGTRDRHFRSGTTVDPHYVARRETGGATGGMHLYRPSDARQDRELPLALNADGMQRLDAKELSGGFWKVRVKWSSNGQEYFLEQPVIVTGADGNAVLQLCVNPF